MRRHNPTDTATLGAVRRRALGGCELQVSHQLTWVLKSGEIAGLGNDPGFLGISEGATTMHA
jgi:hypothetical protein